MEEEMQCELKDIQEAIQRFCAANRNNVVFIADFAAFNPKTAKVKDNILGLYGDKQTLIAALNHLKEVVEDAAKDDFVNV